jgi:hypothetical protein
MRAGRRTATADPKSALRRSIVVVAVVVRVIEEGG